MSPLWLALAYVAGFYTALIMFAPNPTNSPSDDE
jgi:hypothetical protein